MADRTGRALGRLNPVIYFENASGDIVLPPIEMGTGPELARRCYEERYRPKGYEWREADTLPDVRRLQQRMVDKDLREKRAQGEDMMRIREQQRRATSSNLRQRMTSSDCKPFERDFIQIWLDLDDEKKKKYEQRWREYNSYIWALEQDSGTKIEDRIR